MIKVEMISNIVMPNPKFAIETCICFVRRMKSTKRGLDCLKCKNLQNDKFISTLSSLKKITHSDKKH